MVELPVVNPQVDPGPSFFDEVLVQLQRRMRKEQFDRWFRGFSLVRVEREDVEFSVPSGFIRDWLMRNFLSAIQESVYAAAESPRRVSLSLQTQTDETPSVNSEVLVSGSEALVADSAAELGTQASFGPKPRSRAKTHSAEHVGNLMDEVTSQFRGDGADSTESGSASAAKHDWGPHQVRPAQRPAPRSPWEPRLNQNYTFDQFVVGPSNRLAHAAALAIGENPGRAYNPLFIHGNVGLGKTHLLQAICHTVLRRQPGASVLYLSCEDFTNRFIKSVQIGDLDSFRDHHRNVDVLVIDDVQFLANKVKTQEEFFHTFNSLYNIQKQIVISSDRPPPEIPTVEERLVSRFKWGLVTDIETPGFETRVAIVKRKAKMKSVDISDEVAHFIAERIATNIRELEGAVTKVIGVAAITDRAITPELAGEALRGVATARANQITLDRIMSLITSEFSISARDLTGKSRTQAISLPRQIAMHLARKYTDHCFEEIGRFFGNRDHTTVIYAVTKIRDRAKKDRMFRELLDSLCTRLVAGGTL